MHRDTRADLEKRLTEITLLEKKKRKAIDILNDAYEMGPKLYKKRSTNLLNFFNNITSVTTEAERNEL